MWLRPPIRDLFDTLAAAAPVAAESLPRTRDLVLELLVALLHPAAGDGAAAPKVA